VSELVPYTTFLSRRKAKMGEQTERRREELRIIAAQGFITSLVETVVDNGDQTLSTYDGEIMSNGIHYYIEVGVDKKFKEGNKVFFKTKYDEHRRRNIAVGLVLLQKGGRK
jgi:hypothetical protein